MECHYASLKSELFLAMSEIGFMLIKQYDYISIHVASVSIIFVKKGSI